MEYSLNTPITRDYLKKLKAKYDAEMVVAMTNKHTDDIIRQIFSAAKQGAYELNIQLTPIYAMVVVLNLKRKFPDCDLTTRETNQNLADIKISWS